MHLPKALILLLFFMLPLRSTFAQNRTYHHNLFWGRLVLSDTLNAKLRWELWLQQRTQDTQEGTSMFKAPQFSTIWPWLQYSFTPSTKVAVSPISYFNSWRLYTGPSDLEAYPVKEFRWVVRLEHQQRLTYFNYFNRYALEYRLRDMENNDRYISNYRFRYMARLEKAVKTRYLKRPLTLIVNDEVMFQFGEAVRNTPSVFDQNRIYAGFSYEVVKNVKVNAGYLYTVLQRPSGKEFDRINTLWVILTFDHLFSQLYRKQEQP